MVNPIFQTSMIGFGALK